MTVSSESPLRDRVIAVTETRELDVFASLLERRGARVVRCPLVAIRDAPDPLPVMTWLRAFSGGSCDMLILLTGEGLRRLLGCIDRHEPALRKPFLDALQSVRRVTRGPKPARALRQLGLAPDLEATEPTTAGVIDVLRSQNLERSRVGVQLYGSEPNPLLIDFLQRAGATTLPVAPYEYADASSAEDIHTLLRDMTAGSIDAIAFTSKAQVERLFAVAPAASVLAALRATVVAAVGPVVADELLRRGVAVQAMPQASWFMKPLATELASALAQA